MYRRLLALARTQLGLLTLGTASLLVSSGLGLLYPLVVQYLIDTVILAGDRTLLNWAAGGIMAVFVVQAIFAAVRGWAFTVAGERVVADLRVALFDSLLGLDVAFFDGARTGELTNRLSSDTTVLQNAVTVNVSMVLRQLLTTLGSVGLLLWLSPTLTAIALAVVPVVALGLAAYGRVLSRLSRDVQDALAESTSVAEEVIASIRTVRSFAGERAESKRFGEAVEVSFVLAAKRAVLYGGMQGLFTVAGFGSVALVIGFGGRMVMAKTLSLGSLTAFLLYTLGLAVSVATLSSLYASFMKAIGASERVFELIDRTSPLEETRGAAPELRGHVRFDGVRFAYPARPDDEVLAGIDLELRPGKVLALVGPSGSGKSTVAKLMARFYDPNAGAITVDGHDLRSLDPRHLRLQVGAVSQEPTLFATTIADNIRYGRPDASMADIQAAAKAANAAPFIASFDEGYETMVGERGVRLSGGQKQRIAIARALLKDPPILILDEATSALDAESEHLVQEALERLMQGRTTLIIAHRLSTVRDADEVVVLDGGQVVETGTHDELVAADGPYKRLIERQFA